MLVCCVTLQMDTMSFKDAVQNFAEMNNIDFVPNLKRGTHDGKQIYLFGKVLCAGCFLADCDSLLARSLQTSIYLDNQNIYAWLPNAKGGLEWRPISLQDLADKA